MSFWHSPEENWPCSQLHYSCASFLRCYRQMFAPDFDHYVSLHYLYPQGALMKKMGLYPMLK
jgi:hypothetical protein